MVNGIYTSAASMIHLQRKQDVTANNMANANTTGFKLQKLLTEAEVTIGQNAENLLHQDERQNLDEVYTSFEQGPLVQTDNNLDVALFGDGFFQVQTEDGIRYTRKGSFSVNARGDLVTLSGDLVLKDNGDRINIEGKRMKVLEDGSIFVDGAKLGRIGILTFDNNRLLKPVGEGYYENTDPTENFAKFEHSAKLRQGYVEGSNVSLVHSMVNMITHVKNYEASQKAMHSIDETVGKAVNEVGKL